MSQPLREEMLPHLRQPYLKRSLEGRTKMLDEFCEQFGYDRKRAIELLGGRAGWGGDPAVPKGRPRIYGPQAYVRRMPNRFVIHSMSMKAFETTPTKKAVGKALARVMPD